LRDSANIARSGRSQSRQVPGGRIQAIGKGGREVWNSGVLHAILAPRQAGQVVKFASDITAQKIGSMENAGKIAAISRAQAVIEFNLDGTVIRPTTIF